MQQNCPVEHHSLNAGKCVRVWHEACDWRAHMTLRTHSPRAGAAADCDVGLL